MSQYGNYNEYKKHFMKEKIINWPAFKKSKPHMIWAFIIGFFALVGASQFLIAFLRFLF